ncbi:MAG: 6-phosphogluconolactonase [Opitutaceae bacterium]|nr:6-phosphogluconolactonase [Opitutaceae bacterium]
MIASPSRPAPLRQFQADAMPVEVHAANEAMGRAAAAAVADAILALARTQESVRLILGSANSQLSFVHALTREHDLPWNRIEVFHMDEYIGVAADHPASFRLWMKQRLADVVHPAQFHYLAGDAADPKAEAARYARLLREQPIDITCLGFGENGHLAFNDPPFADFDDPETVKIIQLDEASRRQQVGEGHFPSLAAVPTHALTLTIPILLSARRLFGIVPERRKAAAVRAALEGPVTPACPASILRRQAKARLFLDVDAAALLGGAAAPAASAQAPAAPVRGKQAALDAIVRQGFVPIFVNDSLDSRHLVEAAVQAGCGAIEYTCRRPDARRMIPWIKREFPQLVVMAATLMDGPNVEAYLQKNREGFLTTDEAVDLGADALVSFMRFRPATYAKYGRRCVMIPGVATQNEALDQMDLGADLIKSAVHIQSGIDFVTKTSVATHHCIPFFIAGGVNPTNLAGFIQAGVAVGAAGFDVLLGGAKPAASEVTGLARAAIARMLETVREARARHQPALAEAIARGDSNLLAHGRWFNRGPAPDAS